MEMPAV